MNGLNHVHSSQKHSHVSNYGETKAQVVLSNCQAKR